MVHACSGECKTGDQELSPRAQSGCRPSPLRSATKDMPPRLISSENERAKAERGARSESESESEGEREKERDDDDEFIRACPQ